MTAFSFRNSRPNAWVLPRPTQDPHLRRLYYGPIQPMDEPSLLQRLLGRS